MGTVRGMHWLVPLLFLLGLEQGFSGNLWVQLHFDPLSLKQGFAGIAVRVNPSSTEVTLLKGPWVTPLVLLLSWIRFEGKYLFNKGLDPFSNQHRFTAPHPAPWVWVDIQDFVLTQGGNVL